MLAENVDSGLHLTRRAFGSARGEQVADILAPRGMTLEQAQEAILLWRLSTRRFKCTEAPAFPTMFR